MELRINSNASIKLDKFTGIKKINTRVSEFVCKNDTVEGKILIYGSYYQNDLDKKIDFKENIPFTVVFKDNNYLIKNITCENFSYGEVVGRGLDCNFDVVVSYELKKEETASTEEERFEEVIEVESEETVNEIEQVELEEEIEVIQVEELPGATPSDVVDETVSVSRPKEPTDDETSKIDEESSETTVDVVDDYYTQNEQIKEDITKHVDKILQAKMEVKTDNDPSVKFKFGRGKDNKTAIKVIYYRHPNEIEAICNQNNLSIDKVFKDNKNTNFDQYRRIIIK